MVYRNPLSNYFTNIALVWWIVVGMMGIVLGVIAVKLYLLKKVNGFKAFVQFSLSEYMFFVFVGTVLSRKTGTEYLYNLELFWSYRNFIRIGVVGVLLENCYNTLLLLPLGLLCKVINARMTTIRSLVLGGVVSFTIEFLQLIFRKGYFELEDIFHNTLGVLLGYVIYEVLQRLRDDLSNRKIIKNDNSAKTRGR